MTSRPPPRVALAAAPPARPGKVSDLAERCVRGLCWLVIVVTGGVILTWMLFDDPMIAVLTLPGVTDLLGFAL